MFLYLTLMFCHVFFKYPILLKVIDWFVAWSEKRPFPIDMAGFAIHLNLIQAHQSARFSSLVPRGMQESHFLSHLVRVQDLEPMADNCTKVFILIPC